VGSINKHYFKTFEVSVEAHCLTVCFWREWSPCEKSRKEEVPKQIYAPLVNPAGTVLNKYSTVVQPDGCMEGYLTLINGSFIQQRTLAAVFYVRFSSYDLALFNLR